MECFVVAVNDTPEGYGYPPEVRFEIAEPDWRGYRRAADFLNFTNAEVVCVQHEFGIYGGPAGSHLLALLRRLNLPVSPPSHDLGGAKSGADVRDAELTRLSTRIIVMSERRRRMLGGHLQDASRSHRSYPARHSGHAVRRSEFL
jgi:hypothetical protein